MSGRLRLVLLERLGSALLVTEYPQPALETMLRGYFG